MSQREEEEAKKFIDEEIAKLRKQRTKIDEEATDHCKLAGIKNKKAYELSIQLENLKVVRDDTEAAIIKIILDLNKYCTHEKTRVKHRYVEGGYLNKSETITTTFCVLCGVQLNKKIDYGSFE